jgi:hypothetical protein
MFDILEGICIAELLVWGMPTEPKVCKLQSSTIKADAFHSVAAKTLSVLAVAAVNLRLPTELTAMWYAAAIA